jgi:hypothetical protein
LIPVRDKIILSYTSNRLVLGATQPPIHWITVVLFTEGKTAGTWS